MEKRRSSHKIRLLGGRYGEETTGKEKLGKYDKVSSCSAEGCCTSGMHQQVGKSYKKLGRRWGERKSGETEEPSADSLYCYSTPSLCLNYVSFCGWGTGLPPCSPLFSSPPLPTQSSCVTFCRSTFPLLSHFVLCFIAMLCHQFNFPPPLALNPP